MDAKLAKIYYSPQGYWKGVSAIKKLAEAAKVPENVVKQWLYKQAIWQEIHSSPKIGCGDAQLGTPGGPSFFTS